MLTLQQWGDVCQLVFNVAASVGLIGAAFWLRHLHTSLQEVRGWRAWYNQGFMLVRDEFDKIEARLPPETAQAPGDLTCNKDLTVGA